MQLTPLMSHATHSQQLIEPNQKGKGTSMTLLCQPFYYSTQISYFQEKNSTSGQEKNNSNKSALKLTDFLMYKVLSQEL